VAARPASLLGPQARRVVRRPTGPSSKPVWQDSPSTAAKQDASSATPGHCNSWFTPAQGTSCRLLMRSLRVVNIPRGDGPAGSYASYVHADPCVQRFPQGHDVCWIALVEQHNMQNGAAVLHCIHCSNVIRFGSQQTRVECLSGH